MNIGVQTIATDGELHMKRVQTNHNSEIPTERREVPHLRVRGRKS